MDAGVVHQQMDASIYAEDNAPRTGRELAVVRFLDEDRSDEWTQFALTLQGDLGWGQLTSATSYFTRDISYFQDNTDYTFYLRPPYVRRTRCTLIRFWRGSGRPRLERPRLRGPLRAGVPAPGRDGEGDLACRPLLRAHGERLRLLQPHRELRRHAGPSSSGTLYYLVEPGTTDNAFYHSKNDQITEQIAVFGEIGYSPNDRWTFTGGLRWFDHTREREYFIQQPNGRVSTDPFEEGKTTTSDIGKKLSVQYNLNENAMVYALFSDGFRAGGRNVTRPNVGLPPDYDPDFLDNYELGFKSRWDGGRYTFNLTAFKMEWKDYQVEVVDPGLPGIPEEDVLYAVMVTNVGDAEIEGLSVDFTAYLWDSLDFGLNLQLLDPKVTEGNEFLETEAGDRLPFSAEEKGAVWLEYTLPAEIAGGHFYGRFQWTYTGNSLNGISDATLQPAYQISDMKIGFEADDWEIYAYVDNVFDERAILYIQQTPPLGTVTINTPRTWGLGFSKSWGGN